MRRRVRHLAHLAPLTALAAAVTLPACRQPDGTVLYPVLGVGVIALRDAAPAHARGLAANEFTALGVLATPAPPIAGALAGAIRARTLTVAPDADALVHAESRGPRWSISITTFPKEKP